MSVTAGDRLGPYVLVSRIGAGGMGEVWRGRDTRLERSVAVKILPAEFAANAELRIRFEREARAISQLNHPHICTLFDVGENYLVMELLDGESLEERLVRGALPLADVVRYGAQIAEALDRAHRAGIVHRDLKPSNVMITTAGAKLVDFGLAKAVAGFVAAEEATERKRLTERGTIVGTLQYMAPEQLEGADVDPRTDIFALGDVLYEMTTGVAAFQGTSRVSLIAAIVSTQPAPVTQLQPLTPPALEHAIVKCLSKDPNDRWQSARDVAGELRWIGESAWQGSGASAAMPRRTRTWLWIAALLAAIAVAVALAFRPTHRAPVIDAEIMPDGNGGMRYLTGPPALSPDGQWLVYAAPDPSGQRMLWLRSIERGFTRPVAGTKHATAPFWSPDGRFIGFTLESGFVSKVPMAGGEPETIVRSSYGGWAWNRDDVILFCSGGISRVSAAGGAPSTVVRSEDVGADVLGWPTFLPDGKHFFFIATGPAIARRGEAGVWVASLDTSEKPRFVASATSNASYAAPGFVLFARDGILRAQRFDVKRLRAEGEAFAVAPVLVHEWTALFAASDSGLLVYQPPADAQDSQLLLRNRKGELLRQSGPTAFLYFPRISPDGSRIAVDRSSAQGLGDIWIIGAKDGVASRVSFAPQNETSPVWSPRGDEVAYALDNYPNTFGTTLIRQRIGGQPTPVLASARNEYVIPLDWSADGAYWCVLRLLTNAPTDVRLWSLAERKWIDVAASTTAAEASGRFSPDGKWIAYQSDETGRSEIFVQPVPPTGAKYQVSTAGGVEPRWPSRGEIVYVDTDNRLNAVKIETAPLFRSAAPQPLFSIDVGVGAPQFDVTPDGDFLVNSLVYDQPRPMKLISNWFRRLPD